MLLIFLESTVRRRGAAAGTHVQVSSSVFSNLTRTLHLELWVARLPVLRRRTVLLAGLKFGSALGPLPRERLVASVRVEVL